MDYRETELEYAFNKVFDHSISQKEVFYEFKHYLKKLFSGKSFTVLAYGQTGSGKTHTMFGVDTDSVSNKSLDTTQVIQSFSPEAKNPNKEFLKAKVNQRTHIEMNINEDDFKMGIIPRVFNYVFDLVKRSGLKVSVTLSFFQIHRERIYDLLN